MKKKIMILMLLTILSVSTAACVGKEPEINKPPQSTETLNKLPETNETESENSNEPESVSESNSIEMSEKSLEDIENYLLDKGILSGERTQMAASMVGGIDGFKYSDSGIEIYEYDITSEEYLALSNGEEIDLEGMEGFKISAVSINGKFVLLGEPSQEAIDAFNSFK